MTTVAYVRTSTKDQDGKMQIDAIERACRATDKHIAEWYTDIGWSGAKATRPDLERLLVSIRDHKVSEVVVYKLDRLGRSLQHLVYTVDTIRRAGCNPVSLKDGLDFESAAGRMQMGIMMVLAEFERELILERSKAGLARLEDEWKRGGELAHKLGGPTALTPDQLAEARHLRAGGMSWRKLAKAIGAPQSTVRGALNKGTDYIVVPEGDWRREVRRGVRDTPPAPTPRKRRPRRKKGVAA